ncbi:hypothetical protein [Acidovorax sp. FJL06]|uniref:hypothetical protein n=1 Tax=Acidovorax sp. FJL06 TaxID=2153365 RepID=UPI000F577EDF|nr:hypothetical protein [Acidovorax sp. FJL06]RQO82810.1 hypothetical protein DBV10_06710 [Acidovorax sp. FJL06]
MPLIALMGAPHTGAEALALALRQRIPASAARIVEVATPLPTLPPTHPSAALTLLMGLDLPCPAEDRAAQEAIDAQLRAALQHGGVAYRVVYGQGEQRIAHALNAIKKIAHQAEPAGASMELDTEKSPRTPRLRAWDCEKCSDPVCEHRLFTSLVGSRPTARPG